MTDYRVTTNKAVDPASGSGATDFPFQQARMTNYRVTTNKAVDPARRFLLPASKTETAIVFGLINSVVVEEDFVQGLLSAR
jgi:hypothetical protein